MRVVRRIAPLLLATLVAGAGPKDARLLFEDGVRLANDARWAEALESFEASYALVERPSTLFNIGSTLIKLGRPSEAIARLERFIEVSRVPAERASAQALIDEARAARSASVQTPPPPPPPPELSPPPPPAASTTPTEADLVEPTPPPVDEPSWLGSPWVWIAGAAVVVGSAIAVGVVVGSRGEAPYGGTSGQVLQL